MSEPVYRRGLPRIEFDGVGNEIEIPMYEELPDYKLNVRSDDGQPIGVVSETFTTVLNSEMYDIAEAIEGEAHGSVLYETGGSLLGGRKVWLLLCLREPLVIPGDPNGTTLPYFAMQDSKDGSGAFRGQSVMTRIVCHEVGTPMLHKGEWIPVEDHPSVQATKREPGLAVHVEGLPFPEVVTLDHRYMAHEWAESGGQDQRWVQAQQLRKGDDWIVSPIDMTEDPLPDLGGMEQDLDFWWAVGLWWGDGHLNHTRQVTWTVADSEPEILDRLMTFLRRQGFTGEGSQRPGCRQLTWSSVTLYRWLSQFYVGEGTGKGGRTKVPPIVVEHLPHAAAEQVVQGYWDADGSHDVRGGAQWTSSSLDGLLALRRMLARLGRVGSVRKARRETTVTTVAGHTATVRPNWTLRESPNPEGVAIYDGAMVSRVRLVEWVGEREFVPITTEDHTYLTHFGLSHNCDNTSHMADLDAQTRGTEFVFRHTKNIADKIEQAKIALAGWRNSVSRFQLLTEDLIGLAVTKEQRTLFVSEFIPMPVSHMVGDRVVHNVESARAVLRDILEGPTCDGVGLTAYGLVQAATEYQEHFRKAKSPESRFKRTYLERSAVVSDAVKLAREVALS